MPPKLYTGTLGGKKAAVNTPAPVEEECPTKPKRTLSDETKAKLAAARQRKKEEKEAAAAEESREKERLEAEALAQEEAAKQKKELAAAKRREARLKRKAAAAPSSGTGSKDSTPETTPTPESPAKRSKSEGSAKRANAKPAPSRAKKAAETPPAAADEVSSADPPLWFTNYVTNMLNEKRDQEGTKITKKELKAEGLAAAQTKWEDKYTRDRIQNAVDGHMGEMYSMIFA